MADFDLGNGLVLHNVHEANNCGGEYCTIHHPSDHQYRRFPMTSINGIIERVLPDGSFVLDPDSAVFMHTNLIRNSIRCTSCNDHIQSRYRHDFVSCSCGSVFVDGGYSYSRIGGNVGNFIDTSLYLKDDYDIITQNGSR